MARWWKETGIAVTESGDRVAVERPEPQAAERPPGGEAPVTAPAPGPGAPKRGVALVAAAVGLVAAGAAAAAVLRRRRRAGAGSALVGLGRRARDAVRGRITRKG